ncbi:MAG: transcriptional antiterminator, Rof [Candidatus Thiodiazotropha sp. 6PLUC2]
MNDNPYRPIDCGLHESFQYAVLACSELVLHWRDGSGMPHQAQVMPLDVVTRDRAEYLVFREKSGQTLEIRLDWIEQAVEASTGKVLVY